MQLQPCEHLRAAHDTGNGDGHALQVQVRNAAVTGGVQRRDGDARVGRGNQENLDTGIGFGRDQEGVGDGTVGDLGAGAGQRVSGVIKAGGLHGTLAHLAVQRGHDDLAAGDRRAAHSDFSAAEPNSAMAPAPRMVDSRYGTAES